MAKSDAYKNAILGVAFGCEKEPHVRIKFPGE
jgi:hypothetical protein